MEDYVTFEQALRLKELGFDWECDFIYYFTYHNHNKPIFQRYETTRDYEMEKYWDAPTLSQAQKWLREVKVVIVYNVACYNPSVEMFEWDCFIHYTTEDDEIDVSTINHPTYEQALSVGIDKALELLK